MQSVLALFLLLIWSSYATVPHICTEEGVTLLLSGKPNDVKERLLDSLATNVVVKVSGQSHSSSKAAFLPTLNRFFSSLNEIVVVAPFSPIVNENAKMCAVVVIGALSVKGDRSSCLLNGRINVHITWNDSGKIILWDEIPEVAVGPISDCQRTLYASAGVPLSQRQRGETLESIRQEASMGNNGQ